MDATFSAEQGELRRAIRDVVRDRCTSAQRRAMIESGTGGDQALWSLLAGKLGLVGIGVSDRYDGLGGSFVDVAVVLEEAGRALLPVPLLGSTVAAIALDRGDSDVAGVMLPAVARGEHVGCLVVAPHLTQPLSGRAQRVLDAYDASVFVVATSSRLYAADGAGIEVSSRRSFDLTRWQSTVTFDEVEGRVIGDAVASAAAVDVMRVALALEAVGVARQCLEVTTEYLKTRVQFGRAIGSFQALQHRVADLLVAVESAASTAYYAAWAVAESPTEVGVVAPLALAVCGDAAYRAAAETIQMHGGIGFTWEHDAHLYFKRATAIRALLGGASEQRRLVAQRSGLAPNVSELSGR